MLNFANRNLKIFFRDKVSVFFSLLSVFIVIGLYVLFLGDMLVENMKGIEHARFLMDSWVMAGVLAVTAISTTMGAFGIMVEDRAKKTIKDFSASPLKRSSLAGGYIISSFVIGLIMSLIAFVFAEVYIIMYGGELLPFVTMLKVFAIMLISVLSSSAMMFFLVSFFNSQNAFATASTIIGTLVGFLTGIYIPIGNLPDAIGVVVKLFPVSHAGVLFRQVMMENPTQMAFANAPTEVLSEFNEAFGVTFKFGDWVMPVWGHVLVLVATTIVFYCLAILNLSRKKNK